MLLNLLFVSALLSKGSCAHQLLLVSCDGFRYDYLDWYPEETRFLKSLIPKGVHVERMTPAFATKTFPNHWTIVTGLFQESHGIISNSMYDPQFDAWFNKATHEERWWNASLPIWMSAVKQNQKAGTFFWPGSEVMFEGRRQTYYFPYNDSISFEYRVQTVLDWITVERLNLSVLYLEEPDSAGHRYGPNSTEVGLAMAKVDKTIQSLFEGLEKRNYLDKVNVLIVSDHGMAELSSQRVVNFNTTLDKYVLKYLDSGPLFGVNPKPGLGEELVQILQAEIRTKQLPVRVFTKETLPPHYRYSKHRRIPEILVLPNQGYVVAASKNPYVPSKGNHGFDNQYSDMSVPMFAVGPSFKKNVLLNGFHQIDIYGLMCHLLKIKPQPNNGSLDLLPLMLNAASKSCLDSRIVGLSQVLMIFVIWRVGGAHLSNA